MQKKIGILLVCMMLVTSFVVVFPIEMTKATGTTYYVDDSGGADYTSIQDAIDDASNGDTIYVYSGEYVENVDVYKSLIIKSFYGNPLDTIVHAMDSEDHVFHITADNVEISGFSIEGTSETVGTKAGINLRNSHYCYVSNNRVFNNDEGIRLCCGSSNNSIKYNNIFSNYDNGIFLVQSYDNVCFNNSVNSNGDNGFCLYNSNFYNNITQNNIRDNLKRGIYTRLSNNNIIYLNNFINNYINCLSIDSINLWNSNDILDYYYLGDSYSNYLGNYWDDYNGVDEDPEDGIGDTPHVVNSDNRDFYPLWGPWENYFAPSAELPDLTFHYEGLYSPDGIYISPDELVVGESVNIDVGVTNLVEGADAENFYVKFYLGDPDVDDDGVINSDANEIGSSFIEGPIFYGLTTFAGIEWIPAEAGTFDIYVVIDPEIDTGDSKIGLIVESNEGNNYAYETVYVNQLLSVPYFNQGKTEWCWLNTIAMVLQYYGVNDHAWDLADSFNAGRNQGDWSIDWLIVENYVQNKNLEINTAILIPKEYSKEGFFSIHIQNPLDDKIPVILSYKKMINNEMKGHSIVIVGYKIENTEKFVYIHDPSGLFFGVQNDINNMFIKVPYQDLWDDISTLVFIKRINIFPKNSIPPAHPVLYFNEDNEYRDCDISHSEEPEGIESLMFLDKGIKWITSSNPIDLFPEIEPGSQYLRWKKSNIIDLNRLVVSNPSSEPVSISVSIILKENDQIEFQGTIDEINIGIRDQTEIIKDSINGIIPDITFLKSGSKELYLKAYLNGEIVDEIGPIVINVVDPSCFWGSTTCPVDISIIDPDGLDLSKEFNNIPEATYYERDLNDDSNPDDLFIIPERKIGDYHITVIPEPDAKPTDTYTLVVSAFDMTLTLAENVRISDIPEQPYIVRITEFGIFQIITASIDIDPDTLNINSTGNWITCYIELPDGYGIADINISTILLNDVVPSEDHPTNISDYDNDGIPDLMVKFDRQAVQGILEVGDNVAITVTGELIDETRFVGIDYIRVI